jgi:predicted nucleic acid-binding protein
LSFDLAATLRRLKPQKRVAPLMRRDDRELPFAKDHIAAGPQLLLDTSVYIDVLKGRAPPELRQLLAIRQLNHSSVALAELVHLFGRLDPTHRGTRPVLDQITGVIDDIPPHRLTVPSIQASVEAGIVTGTISRLIGLPRTQRQPLLHDATLFLQALENGWVLLSGNIKDIDLIDQLVPGRMLLYRQVD